MLYAWAQWYFSPLMSSLKIHRYITYVELWNPKINEKGTLSSGWGEKSTHWSRNQSLEMMKCFSKTDLWIVRGGFHKRFLKMARFYIRHWILWLVTFSLLPFLQQVKELRDWLQWHKASLLKELIKSHPFSVSAFKRAMLSSERARPLERQDGNCVHCI